MVGKIIKGAQAAAKKAIAAHREVNRREEWVVTIGWDCMVDDQDEIVFFEGNFAGARCPRVMFLNHRNTLNVIKNFYWPFDRQYCVTPSH